MDLVGDIKIFYVDFLPGDLQVEGSDLANDTTLRTSILISLLTDRRADPDDAVPNVTETHRGWWADALTDIPIGSKLWLLGRSTINNETLTKSELYISECLGWMITDLLIQAVHVTSEQTGPYKIAWNILLERKKERNIFFRFFADLDNQTIGGL